MYKASEVYQWIANFYEHEAAYIEDDELGTTFCTSGVVFLAASLTDSQSVHLIASATGLPCRFVNACLLILHHSGMVTSTSYSDLQECVSDRDVDLTYARECLRSLMEEIWGDHITETLTEALQLELGGIVFTGKNKLSNSVRGASVMIQ